MAHAVSMPCQCQYSPLCFKPYGLLCFAAMKSFSGTVFLCVVAVPAHLGDSFLTDPLSFRPLAGTRGGILSDHAANNLFMALQETEVKSPFESSTEFQNQVSLAADYRVDISYSRDVETWSLTPIASVVEDGALPEGAQANRALHMNNTKNSPAVSFQCSQSGDNLVVTVDSDVNTELAATLSRIMVQQWATRRQEPEKRWTISLPGEESLVIEDICAEAGVLELFQPIIDTTNVELVEMVDRNASPWV